MRAARALAATVAPLIATGALLVATSSGAQAAPTEWQSPFNPAYDDQNATVQVSTYADLKKKGFEVNLGVRFTCPKGETYTITGDIQELNPLREPILDGDQGIPATLTKAPTGRCNGKAQTTTMRFTVQPFTVDEYATPCWTVYSWDTVAHTTVPTGQKCYTPGDYYVPIVPTGTAGEYPFAMGEPFVRVSGRNFSATYDAWEASCCGNAPNIAFR
jgi:hypothetical protein